MASARSTSRFRETNLIVSKDGHETFGLVEGFDALRSLTGDQYTTFKVPSGYEGRPDNIAFHFYNDAHLEWIIVAVNRPKNPLGWPKLGVVIKIPTKAFIRTLF